MKVHTVTAGATSFTCNAYLATGERPALVDAGAYAGVIAAIEDQDRTPDVVVLTHQHGDHASQLDAVLDAFDAQLACYGEHPRRDRALADGDEVPLGDERFEVVHTPGHADDHVSFVSEHSLFPGDVVVHDDGAFEGGSFGRTDYPGQSREVLIESIERLLDRMPDGVEHMYSGHGEAFHGDLRSIVGTALERAKRREPKYPDE
jgi:glyoxylase-like metal-dependent hydrolase (beta-lactamase superfamily II)